MSAMPQDIAGDRLRVLNPTEFEWKQRIFQRMLALLGGAFGQAAIEAQCKQLVDAAGRNSFPLIASTTYSCRNRARCVRKVLFGMRPKGHKAREHLILMRARRNGCKQGAMATMHAIEISDGQGGCWRGLLAALGRPTNDLHKRPL